MLRDKKICVFVVVVLTMRMAISANGADVVSDNPVYDDVCVKSCPVTYDYSPFCGTDGYTYNTRSYLGCFQACRIPLSYDGECLDENDIFQHPCVRSCVVTAVYDPFCGSDSNTYSSKAYLDCFEKCEIPIALAYDGECKDDTMAF